MCYGRSADKYWGCVCSAVRHLTLPRLWGGDSQSTWLPKTCKQTLYLSPQCLFYLTANRWQLTVTAIRTPEGWSLRSGWDTSFQTSVWKGKNQRVSWLEADLSFRIAGGIGKALESFFALASQCILQQFGRVGLANPIWKLWGSQRQLKLTQHEYTVMMNNKPKLPQEFLLPQRTRLLHKKGSRSLKIDKSVLYRDVFTDLYFT